MFNDLEPSGSGPLAVDFSYMAWEPRILKQAPGYNDPKALYDSIPYVENYKPHAESKKCLIIDTKTGQSRYFDTLKAAGAFLDCTGRNVSQSIKEGRLVFGRYKAEIL
jgi:hypothetical protein